MSEPWLDDGDVRIYVGDALETLADMPDGSVDCVVTSPPYWGLRDYGTGLWAGGDPDCDHLGRPKGGERTWSDTFRATETEERDRAQFSDVCGKCGAQRTDQQHGLEPTPDLYVANMVAMFREIRRVLAPHGTCWVNLGDSYTFGGRTWPTAEQIAGGKQATSKSWLERDATSRVATPDGLKPKDLVGIPWRVAFALQADGWWLRSEIIWAKPNPMPESVTDRPTKSHEQIFLLTKQPRYWFDAEAVRERAADGNTSRVAAQVRHGTTRSGTTVPGAKLDDSPYVGQPKHRGLAGVGTTFGSDDPAGRNVRSVWEIATQPYAEAHFATFPEELVRRCLLAGCPTAVCRVCGLPRERIVERGEPFRRSDSGGRVTRLAVSDAGQGTNGTGATTLGRVPTGETVGWSDCGHNDYRPGVVLDPFLGSGTTALVARKHGRHAVGIELSADYAALAGKRLQQLSLLA